MIVNVPGTTNITKYGDKGILGLGPCVYCILRFGILLTFNPHIVLVDGVSFARR